MPEARRDPQRRVLVVRVIRKDALQRDDALVHFRELDVVVGLLCEMLKRQDRLPDEVAFTRLQGRGLVFCATTDYVEHSWSSAAARF